MPGKVDLHFTTNILGKVELLLVAISVLGEVDLQLLYMAK